MYRGHIRAPRPLPRTGTMIRSHGHMETINIKVLMHFFNKRTIFHIALWFLSLLNLLFHFSYHSPDGVFSTGSVWELCVNKKLALIFLKYLSFVFLTTISTNIPPTESVYMCVMVCGLQNGINLVVLGLEGEVSPWERQRILNKAVRVKTRQRESLHMRCTHEFLWGAMWISPFIL